MAKIIKHPLSVEGKYYVDADVCLICNCCVEEAPNNFKYDEVEMVSYVCKQPTTIEEEKLCEQALHCCPVEAIGNDGLNH
jgi:ferredoxin